MDDSSNEPGDFKIKGAATRILSQSEAKRDDYHETCSICLEPISERAVAVSCNHLTFDFVCLVSWLQEQPNCPLCKAKVTAVQYDWRSPEDYKTYHVSKVEPPKTDRAVSRQSRQNRQFPRNRRIAELSTSQAQIEAGQDGSLERRRHIYRSRLYSLRVGANHISRYQDFTANDFSASAELQSRARAFLRRELQVFTFLDRSPRGGNRDFLIEYLVAELKLNDLRGADGQVEGLLRDFLGLENARQMLHELEAWLRSPYTNLRDWDAHVQYADHDSRAKRQTG